MLNRLLENWLDSASEKTYQPVLCQILSAKGHTILHSTRHGPLEFGKDIITIDPDRNPCAYQLKGNPGARLTPKQFVDIQGQIVQLVTQPIEIPGYRVKRHKTYLVTNGLIDEEVIIALNQLNRGFEEQGTIGFPVEVISRGHLLQWTKEYGLNLWPTESDSINILLQLLTFNGKDCFPINLLHNLLAPFIRLTEGQRPPGVNNLRRKIYSSAILTAICLKKFNLEKNHFAIISAWVVYCAYIMSACDRFGYSYKINAKKAIDLALISILTTLSDLCEELRENKSMVERDAVADNFIYKWRYTLLVALMALFWFWCENEGWPKEGQRDFVRDFLPRNFDGLFLWGEGVIPQLLIFIWYLRATDPTINPDFLLGKLLDRVVALNTDKNLEPLASPYYSYEIIASHVYRDLLGLREDPFKGDSFRNDSFFAEGLLHLLVRTNLKQVCKKIWPGFSKLGLKHFSLSRRWQYCLSHSHEGEEITVQPPLTKEWEQLVEEARKVSCPEVPTEMAQNKFLLMIFIIIFPYRALPSVIRYLGRAFNDCWFIPPPQI